MHRGQHAMFLAPTQDKTDSQGRQGWIILIWAKAITEKKTKCFQPDCLCSNNPISIPLRGGDTYIDFKNWDLLLLEEHRQVQTM